MADAEKTRHEYNLELADMDAVGKVDTAIFAVSHDAFKAISPAAIAELCANGQGQGTLIDVKSVFQRQDIEAVGLRYWSL